MRTFTTPLDWVCLLAALGACALFAAFVGACLAVIL